MGSAHFAIRRIGAGIFVARRAIIAVPLALSLTVAGCGRSGPDAAPPPQVAVAPPLVKDIVDWDEYTGRLESVESVEIRARVNGYVQSVHFNDGALVKADDLLFVIDPRPYRAALDEAQAQRLRAQVQLELATSELARAGRLFKARAVSEEELDERTQQKRQAQASLEASRAAVEAARLDLEFTSVRAPIAGRIGRKLVTPGNLISGGTSGATLLTTLVSIDPIHVYFTADERAYLYYQRLASRGVRPSSRVAANPVRMQLADEQGFPHEGRMDFVDNRLDASTGTMQGRAIFSNPDGFLTPGVFVRLQLRGEGPYVALLVPDAAIGTDQARRFVYVLGADNKVTPRPISPGRSLGQLRIVREGLAPTDRIVVSGLQRIRAGMIVAPVPTTVADPDATAPASAQARPP